MREANPCFIDMLINLFHNNITAAKVEIILKGGRLQIEAINNVLFQWIASLQTITTIRCDPQLKSSNLFL